MASHHRPSRQAPALHRENTLVGKPRGERLTIRPGEDSNILVAISANEDPVGSNVEVIPSYIARICLKPEHINLFAHIPVLISKEGGCSPITASDFKVWLSHNSSDSVIAPDYEGRFWHEKEQEKKQAMRSLLGTFFGGPGNDMELHDFKTCW